MKYHLSESFICSSLWVQRQSRGLQLRPDGPTFIQLMLLLCGDVETCPGPSIKCCSCAKTVRKNQSRATCVHCRKTLHLKCLTKDLNERCCLSCLTKVNRNTPNEVTDIQNNGNGANSNTYYDLPELAELQKKPGLKILHQNIRGLLLHKYSICHLLESFKKINVLSLSETHLSKDDEAQAKISGYDFISKPRLSNPDKGGGVGLYIASHIPYQRRFDLEQPDIECIWLEILFPKTKGILIGIIYRPPDTSKYLPDNYETKFKTMMDIISAENKETLILGDLNCNYQDKTDHKELKDLLSSFGLKQMIKAPTRITRLSSTLIDVICSNEPLNIFSATVIPAGLSDHELIACVRKMHNIKQKPREINCRNYSKYNPASFCEDLETRNLDRIYSATSVNAAVKMFNNILSQSIDKHAPFVKKRIKGRLCPWLSAELKQEMNHRDQLLRKARRTNTELDWSAYKRCRNRVNNLVKSNKARYNKELLRDNADSAEKFWSAIKKIYPTKETSMTVTSMIEVNGKKTTNINEIANAFSKHFATVASTLKAKSLLLRNFIWMPQKCSVSNGEKLFRFQKVNSIQVYNELKGLKRKKAVGVDKFPSGMIKDAASVLAASMTFLINMSMQTGLVPSDWKIAKVIPVFKSGNKSELDNYRPISVLPILSKLLEKFVHKQLIDHLEKNCMLFNFQFGFRSKRSTELAVTLLTDYIRNEADKGSLTGAVFIDLSKAFDTVSHSSLLDKLPSFGIYGTELNWFTDYLFNRSQFVQNNGCTSDVTSVFCGVPQGSIIGPLLFIMHLNGAHTVLQNSKIITYADDTVVFVSGSSLDEIERKLNHDLQHLKAWFDENELLVNLKKGKTESMVFGTAKRLSKTEKNEMKVEVNGTPIAGTSSYKYLGVYLDQTLNFAIHFEKTYKKATGRLNLLRRIRSSIDTASAEKIYRTMIMPVFGYCGSLSLGWSALYKKRIESIERRSHDVIRSTKVAPVSLRVPSIEAGVKKRSCNLVFDTLQGNVCDAMKNYFVIKAHGKNTRNDQHLVNLPQVKTEFGRKGFYYLAGKEFNDLPLSARKIESRLLFRQLLEKHFNM